jgi:hypothetical protein
MPPSNACEIKKMTSQGMKKRVYLSGIFCSESVDDVPQVKVDITIHEQRGPIVRQIICMKKPLSARKETVKKI